MREYNGGLTREQFLFYEIRIMASLVSQGYIKAEAIEKIREENLFQFPTERMIASIANTCFHRLSALESDALVLTSMIWRALQRSVRNPARSLKISIRMLLITLKSSKAEKSFVSGHIIELDRRYVIADGDCTADHMLKIPMTHLSSNLIGFAPLDNIRMKKQGGGMNYVHGGISLQECVVPVVEFKNMRSTSKKFVDVKKAALELISQSRKVSNSIFSLDFYQKEAVSGKVAAATYEIYMADASGKAVSDKKTVIADKTSNNGSDRVFRTRFTLKSVEFKKTDTYYLTVVEKGTTNVTDRIEFTIDIAFVNDFDF